MRRAGPGPESAAGSSSAVPRRSCGPGLPGTLRAGPTATSSTRRITSRRCATHGPMASRSSARIAPSGVAADPVANRPGGRPCRVRLRADRPRAAAAAPPLRRGAGCKAAPAGAVGAARRHRMAVRGRELRLPAPRPNCVTTRVVAQWAPRHPSTSVGSLRHRMPRSFCTPCRDTTRRLGDGAPLRASRLQPDRPHRARRRRGRGPRAGHVPQGLQEPRHVQSAAAPLGLGAQNRAQHGARPPATVTGAVPVARRRDPGVLRRQSRGSWRPSSPTVRPNVPSSPRHSTARSTSSVRSTAPPSSSATRRSSITARSPTCSVCRSAPSRRSCTEVGRRWPASCPASGWGPPQVTETGSRGPA